MRCGRLTALRALCRQGINADAVGHAVAWVHDDRVARLHAIADPSIAGGASGELDGALFIVGRTKEVIIRSGFNVYPVEVESVLNSHPQVTQSAVVGREVEGNEEVIAFVELAPGATVSVHELQEFAAEALTAYKRPAEIIVMPSLPAAANGKILKHRLKEMAKSGTVPL